MNIGSMEIAEIAEHALVWLEIDAVEAVQSKIRYLIVCAPDLRLEPPSSCGY
jgi:hypothetical protein